MPIAAGILAWLGIGASQLSFFAEYRPLFIGIAIVALLFGFWQVYFKKKVIVLRFRGAVAAKQRRKKKNRNHSLFRRCFLWIGAIVVIAMLFMGNQEAKAPKWLRSTTNKHQQRSITILSHIDNNHRTFAYRVV